MADLSTIERLILAQAVYEHGADAWQSVADLLAAHPALRARLFSPQSCRQFYLHLMNEASLECSEDNNKPRAPQNLSLAQRHYVARLLHLRDLIAAEEVRFKSIVAEIDEIRCGAWDEKIKAKLAGNGDANPTDVADSQDPVQLVSEPLQAEATDLASPDDHGTVKETVETDDAQVDTVDDVAEERPVEVPTDTPLDSQITETIPVAEDAVPEPTPVHVTEAASEELTTVETTSEANNPEPEFTEMDVEESVTLPEPEEKPSESQQREGKRKASDSDNVEQSSREKKRARDESTPTDVDEQSSRPRTAANNDLVPHQQTPPPVPNKRFQAVIGMLHSQISQHRNGNIFHNPIKNSEAPDYHDIIKRPMDLKTIKARIKDGVISNSLEFQRDVYLMFANAMMYNRPTSDIYHMAEEMMAESEEHINTFRQTEGFIRSTRS